MSSSYRSFIPLSAFGAFHDPIMLRDPSGGRGSRGPRARAEVGPEGVPSLVLGGRPVVLRTSFRVAKEDGIRFADVTGDDNPIHREGEVIPGALTVSRIVLPLEIMLPHESIQKLEATFTGVARYGYRTCVNGRLWAEDDATLHYEAWLSQGDARVATLRARLVHTGPGEPVAVSLRRDVRRELDRARAFLRSCRVRPSSYFRKPWGMDLSYPTAFLAALPSGELVRQFQGASGGLLNRLTLEFDPGRKVALASKELPEAAVELRSPLRKTFNRVATMIRAGLVTFGRGTALVLSSEGAASRRALA